MCCDGVCDGVETQVDFSGLKWHGTFLNVFVQPLTQTCFHAAVVAALGQTRWGQIGLCRVQ